MIKYQSKYTNCILYTGSDIVEGNVTREEFRSETDKIYSKLNSNETRISVLEVLVEKLGGLPDAINKLDKNMMLMEQNLKNLNEQIQSMIKKEEQIRKENKEQNEKIRDLDNKSKVDILTFLKSNWWKIMISAATLWVIFEKYIMP